MKSEIKISCLISIFFRNQPPGLSSRKVMESPEDNRRVCITFAILFLEENITFFVNSNYVNTNHSSPTRKNNIHIVFLSTFLFAAQRYNGFDEWGDPFKGGPKMSKGAPRINKEAPK